MGQVRQAKQLGNKKSRKTHTQVPGYGKVRSRSAEVYPKLFLPPHCVARNENAFSAVGSLGPGPLLRAPHWWNDEVGGRCVGIKMAGGEVFVRVETPPPSL